jgi:hypothetical protein
MIGEATQRVKGYALHIWSPVFGSADASAETCQPKDVSRVLMDYQTRGDPS